MRIQIILLMTVLFCATPSFSQQKAQGTTSLSGVLQEVFDKVKQNSVFRKIVSWDELEHKIFDFNGEEITGADFKEKVRLIFTTIGDKHGAFFIMESV